MGVMEKEKRQQVIGNLFEKIMTEDFPNWVKKIDIQVQVANRVPNKMSPNRPAPIHIIIKMQKVKDKERLLKGKQTNKQREKQ